MSDEKEIDKREYLNIPMYIVDAFTSKPFEGNPAAICLINYEMGLTSDEMQKIAKEMNLSETAFVTLTKGDFQSSPSFGLRWFTPTTEVSLCGHATLASAAVLFNEAGNQCEQIHFDSLSGELTVERSQKDLITLNFPLNPPEPKNVKDFKALLEVCVDDLSDIDEIQLSATGKLLIRLKDSFRRDYLETMQPRTNEMIASLPDGLVKGVGITVKGSVENGSVDSEGNVYDFISRYFAPWLGIHEDPVTGSWHTVASAYWAKNLNKTNLYARQCSQRGGDLWIKVLDTRVTLSGKAVVNLRGQFTIVK
ncbi:phenazine biosynthesis-like domain-containing protein [Biomphalaria glabrata]|uniref:Phenazine biosynthesis-like domain-containing protein 1 n=1 Tax=Biomphalaria glabrata TaxID=6526 RepID=A0A9W2ZMK4_BIOGL|nr:phenazine biosynthesis-like domain-containing protein 1 [Biomphalaria glabrata]KAI8765721.1 phenazine biosynthesis-like domain-containing protein [Biomphalaria glabrata]